MLLCSHVFLLLAALAVATPPASADNLSSVNLIANGSFDTPATAANPLSAGWQPLNPWGSVTVGLETGRKYAPYEIRGAGGPRGDKPRKWLARFRGPYHGNIWRSQNPQYAETRT